MEETRKRKLDGGNQMEETRWMKQDIENKKEKLDGGNKIEKTRQSKLNG